MADIKPAEISAIIKKQLTGSDIGPSLAEVGTVLQVGDGIARVYGLSNVQYGELVMFENGMEGIVLNLEEDNVGVVLLGPSKDVKEGDTVKRTERIASINVGDGVVGRVVNTLGEQIDGKGKIIEIYDMVPLSKNSVCSIKASKYALEVNSGWFDKNEIMTGDVIKIKEILSNDK